MKFKPSTEMTLDAFLKLPRLSQLMFFERMNNGTLKNANPYYVYDIAGFDAGECKSPIEQILYNTFNVRVVEREIKEDIYLISQKQISIGRKRHYADLYFDTEEALDLEGIDFRLVIECDGHDYHHASKQQVRKDYERETALKMAGYDILRFTGSQIYDDPCGCADIIIDYILSKIRMVNHE